jgi:tRNA dimethylallyltransferase
VTARQRLVVVAGPTAAGKSALALQVAQALQAELLIADSRQVYRRMDVGTAKATANERRLVLHHGVDVVEPGEQFDASLYRAHALGVLADARARGVSVVVEGGTGLYLRALVKGLMEAPSRDDAFRAALREEAAAVGWPALHARLLLVDPVYAARIAATDPVRITRALEVFHLTGQPFSALEQAHAGREAEFDALGFLVTTDAQVHQRNVTLRVERMWSGGLLDETAELLKLLGPEHPLLGTINYAQARDHLAGTLSPQAARAEMVLRTTQFAKRQRTWFRKETWLTPCLPTDAESVTEKARAFLG